LVVPAVDEVAFDAIAKAGREGRVDGRWGAGEFKRFHGDILSRKKIPLKKEMCDERHDTCQV